MEGYVKMEGFDYYHINRMGKIYSDKSDKVLLTQVKNGYEYIPLQCNGKSKQYRVHRLVAMTFIDNPENKPFVNHINADKLDNRVENLEWCTMEENQHHSNMLGLSDSGRNTPRGILRINPIDNTQKEYSSILNAVRDLYPEGSSKRLIRGKSKGVRKVLNGMTKSHKGYIFKYIEE